MRHAKSSWKDKSLEDSARPLKLKGIKDAETIASLMGALYPQPELIISSPARRARQTADLVAENLGLEDLLREESSFYPGDADEYFVALRRIPDEINTVLVVGHNPGLEAVLQQMLGQVVVLPTGGLAMLELRLGSWQELTEVTENKLLALVDPETVHIEEMEKTMSKDKKKDEKKEDKKPNKDEKKGDKKDKKDKKK